MFLYVLPKWTTWKSTAMTFQTSEDLYLEPHVSYIFAVLRYILKQMSKDSTEMFCSEVSS